MAVFNKNIHDEIANVTSTTNTTVGAQVYTQNTTQASNVGTASVTGLELGYTQVRFTSLPAPWSDFGVSANVTVMDQHGAGVAMSNGTVRAMPQLQDSPKNIGN